MSKQSNVTMSGELCFDTKEFLEESFSVDTFLHNHRNAGSLEQIRDDLGLYLKELRTAMIELINQDYQDFVNLSAELVDLDQRIETIRKPLVDLREEILQLRGTVTGTMGELTSAIETKRAIQSKEKEAHETQLSLEMIERVKSQLEEEDDLTRIGMNVVHIQHTIRHFSIEGALKVQAIDIQRVLLDVLSQKFMKTLAEKDVQGIEKCLKIYEMLNQYGEAEECFKEKSVIPVMNQLISDASLQNSPRGVIGIYDQIIDFIHVHMTELLAASKKFQGFNFLYNSFWSEVEQRIELGMSSIFAPGNPDLFHQKFLSTLDFLARIEAFTDGNFRDHPQYKSFLTKWNLPVYFQIRFQEIGASLEAACSRDINKELISSNNELLPFPTTVMCFEKSWGDGVFLPQLFGRFLKLTLQFLSRLATWIDHAVEITLDDPALPKSSFLMLLYINIVNFEEKFPYFLAQVLAARPHNLSIHDDAVRTCFGQSQKNLMQRLGGIETRIAADLIANSSPYIKQVNDIPRLYRKTNREVPVKNCAYVDHTLAPAREFHQKHVEQIGVQKCSQFLLKVFESLTIAYHGAVTEVLISVQKTEESLRRLKNLRGTATQETTKQGMSDDDKIRLQLQLDVIYWLQAIEEFAITPQNLPKLVELQQIVEDATKLHVENK